RGGSVAGRVGELAGRVTQSDAARRPGQAGGERLICLLRACVAAAAEQVERTGGEGRPVRDRRERDVARSRTGAVDELVAAEVERARGGVVELDELVGRRGCRAGRELVYADGSVGQGCAGEDGVRGAVVGHGNCAVAAIRPTSDPVQPLEGVDAPRVALRPGRTTLALRPGRALSTGRTPRALGAGYAVGSGGP